jgi:acetylornithine deacetylase
MNGSDLSLTGLLARLVSFDTVSRNSNLGLIAFAAEWLESHAFRCTWYHSPRGDKANLVARLGPDEAGGLLLSGHSDVVPVEGQVWSSDPFTLTARDGRLVGRGSADMKGFIALALDLARRLRPEDLARPLWVCLSYDEEVGCLGIQDLMSLWEQTSAPRPAWALVGEPTGLRVCLLHKGMGQMTIRVHGVEGHSSRPERGVNAIEAAAELLQAFETIRAELRRSVRHAELLEPPYSTFSTGWIRGGGDVVNIIPNRCMLSTDLRLAPGAPLEEVTGPVAEAVSALDQKLKSRDPRAGASMELNRNYPPYEMSAAAPLAKLLRSSVPDPRPIAVSFATEAAALVRAGVEAVVCGPGSILQAHRPDESIGVDELQQAGPWIEGIVRRVCVERELG